MSLVRSGPIELLTFDGDVTLYDDGQSLDDAKSPIVQRMIALLHRGAKIGIVTAAGYTLARKYYERLRGLLDAMNDSDLSSVHKENLIVLGGEANYMFKFAEGDPDRLKHVPRQEWLLPEMRAWQEPDIVALLDLAEAALKGCVANLHLEAHVLRKDR